MSIKSNWYQYIIESNLTITEVVDFYEFIVKRGDNPDLLTENEIKSYWRKYVTSITNNPA